MKKVNLLRLFCVVLLAANVVLLWFLLSDPRLNDKKEGPKKVIIERLHFDKAQTRAYEKLIVWHKSEIRKTEEKMKGLKNQLYRSLQGEKERALTEVLVVEIGKAQMEIEQINYKHFGDIKKLCKPGQLNEFDALCEDIAKLFAHKGPPPHAK